MQRKRRFTSVLAILLAGTAAQADLLSADVTLGSGSLASADASVGGGKVGATATVGSGSRSSGGSIVDASVSVGGGGAGASIGIGGSHGGGSHGGGGDGSGGDPANHGGGSSSFGGSINSTLVASGAQGSGSRLGVASAIRNMSLYSSDEVRLGTILSMEDAGSLVRVTIKLDPSLGHGTSRMTFRTAVQKTGKDRFRIGQPARAFVSLL